MNKTKTGRKAPMTFINRGGKGASGAAVDDEDPDRSPMEGRSVRTGPAYDIERMEADRAKSSGRAQRPLIRSSRI